MELRFLSPESLGCQRKAAGRALLSWVYAIFLSTLYVLRRRFFHCKIQHHSCSFLLSTAIFLVKFYLSTCSFFPAAIQSDHCVAKQLNYFPISVVKLQESKF